MTDLEMMRLCAEAMGLQVREWRGPMDSGPLMLVEYHQVTPESWMPQRNFDPLHDDAQAMAVVKKLRLSVNAYNDEYQVWPTQIEPGRAGRAYTFNRCLNRAIVECVAKIQASKGEAK